MFRLHHIFAGFLPIHKKYNRQPTCKLHKLTFIVQSFFADVFADQDSGCRSEAEVLLKAGYVIKRRGRRQTEQNSGQ